MLNVIAHARALGYIKCRDDLFVQLGAVHKMADQKVVVLTTGSQGEPMAAMTRIANQEHRQVKLRQGDTVVFSANPIPGNTIAVVNTIDKIMMQGAKVIYGRSEGIHVSGHGCQEDQKLMLALTKPRFFLPVHGEHRMLIKHSKTAQSMGVPAENMVIIENGDIVELGDDSIKKNGKVPAGIELMDTSRSGVVTGKILEERQQIAGDGVVTIAATVTQDGKLYARPEVHLRGVVTTIDRGTLQNNVQEVIESVLTERWGEFARRLPGSEEIEMDWAGLQVQMDSSVMRLLKRELQSSPMLVFFMQNPEEVVSIPPSGRRVIGNGRPTTRNGSSGGSDRPVKVAGDKPKPVLKPETATTTPAVVAESTNSTTATGRRRTRSSAKVGAS
jgi:ribonuclease J